MEIYNQLPKELQNKVFYFMSHPCADMIKQSYIYISSFGWIDEDDDDILVEWKERQFNLSHGRMIELSDKYYNYEERLNNIKNKILDSESDSDYDSDSEYDRHPHVSSDCYVS